MKGEIKEKRIRFENCPNVEARLDIRLEEMESTRAEMTRKLKAIEKEIISRSVDKLCFAADISEELKNITAPTQKDVEEIIYKDGRFLEDINAAHDKIELLKVCKLNRFDMPIIRNVIDDADHYLQEYFQVAMRETYEYLNKIYRSIIDDADKSKFGSKAVNSEKLAMDITDKILQTSPFFKINQKLVNNLDLKNRAKQALDDYLGSQLIDTILNPSAAKEPTVYPTLNKTIALSVQEAAKIRRHHQQRLKIEASLPKLSQMEKETNETIALFESNLNSLPVKHLWQNLENMDRVLKSHREVLEFMNDPEGQHEITKLSTKPLTDQLKIPNTIQLNEADKNISAALATAIVGYTKQLCFSDLLERVDKLEKRLS
ncbi:hypothetical protein [Parasitella parasitica]|uniref:Uncharacterized protein n=1 Tax=Parasitella parasitica TaxID=35722 RepID=A0A0B7N630_9FUNG|nr:hypothetical protein [Parasitella parasitica]